MEILQIKNKLRVLGMNAEPRERKNNKDGTVKVAPNGQKTYWLGGVTLSNDGNGPERNITVHACENKRLLLGKTYEVAGEVWATPYVKGNFPAVSIIAERMEEVTPTLEGLPARPKREG